MKPILQELWERKLIESYDQGKQLIADGNVSVDGIAIFGDFLIPPFMTISIEDKDYPYSMYPKMRG